LPVLKSNSFGPNWLNCAYYGISWFELKVHSLCVCAMLGTLWFQGGERQTNSQLEHHDSSFVCGSLFQCKELAWSFAEYIGSLGFQTISRHFVFGHYWNLDCCKKVERSIPLILHYLDLSFPHQFISICFGPYTLLEEGLLLESLSSWIWPLFHLYFLVQNSWANSGTFTLFFAW
jgi:hypothetical protein